MALTGKGSGDVTNGSASGTFCGILNYCNGNTVNHSLVLLEGEINIPIDNTSTKLAEQTLNPENGICVTENVPDKTEEFSSSKEGQILLVHHKGSCRRWPVIKGRFKAFVKLDQGVNKLEFELASSQNKLDLILTYRKFQNQQRFVKVVYIKCSDSNGLFDAPDNRDNDLDVALKKLRFNALLLQTFTAMDMYKHGFGYQTFQLEEDENDEVKVHVFDSKLTTEQAQQMNGGKLYSWFYSELLNSSLHDPKCKFLVFMSCTHYDPPHEMNVKHIAEYVKAHTALGGGHLGLFGTAGLHTWAKDLGELVTCFTDCREIDKKTLFDDSAGRGTFWANYSTTLGAALHELGHCFDLAHTPKGIMARGFDDMNHFFTVTKPREIPRLSSTELVKPGDEPGEIFFDHEAHWFRSSAVLLHYHKWFRGCSDPTSASEENDVCLQVNWSPHVKGPVGNGGGGQKNQTYFDEDLISGYVVYHSEYINALKLLKDSNNTSSQDSPLLGKVDDESTAHVFPLEEGEYLVSVEICAGAWIDGMRLHTNRKSSIWFGGRGGSWYHLKPTTGDRITGIFGTFGDFIGSLGIRVNQRPSSNETQHVANLEIQSDLGIRLVELRKGDELVKYWEFVDQETPPTTFCFPAQKIQDDLEDCSVFVEDNEGNICESGFGGYKRFVEGARELDTAVSSLA